MKWVDLHSKINKHLPQSRETPSNQFLIRWIPTLNTVGGVRRTTSAATLSQRVVRILKAFAHASIQVYIHNYMGEKGRWCRRKKKNLFFSLSFLSSSGLACQPLRRPAWAQRQGNPAFWTWRLSRAAAPVFLFGARISLFPSRITLLFFFLIRTTQVGNLDKPFYSSAKYSTL